MAYRFRHGDATIEDGVRRIALEQIDRAIREVADTSLDTERTIHQVRKRCKKLRGLIRLVRPAFAAYAEENAFIRDAAGDLSFLRDSDVLIGAHDRLVAIGAGRIDPEVAAAVRAYLVRRRAAVAAQHDMTARLAIFGERMASLRDRADGWSLDRDGFRQTIGAGLRRTYRRGRTGMALARRSPGTEAFHDWRKRVKYHGYHARLLAPAWPDGLRAHCDAAGVLGDLLGDHHDLDVLRQTVLADREEIGSGLELGDLYDLMGERQTALSADAFALGARLFAEKPGALEARWTAYWNGWREEAPPRARADQARADQKDRLSSA